MLTLLLDALFPPSLDRLTRGFDKQRARFERVAERRVQQSIRLQAQAETLASRATAASDESFRAMRIAGRFKDLTA